MRLRVANHAESVSLPHIANRRGRGLGVHRGSNRRMARRAVARDNELLVIEDAFS